MNSYCIELEIDHQGNTHQLTLEVHGEVTKDWLMYPNEDIPITAINLLNVDVIACEPPLSNVKKILMTDHGEQIQDLWFQEYVNDDSYL